MSDLADINKRTDTGPAGTASARDGLGDEFAHVPSPRTRHPLVAVAAALLAFFIVYYKRADLTYSLTSSEPRDLGTARSLFAPPAAKVASASNRYVRVAGVPDRENALELDTKGSWTFTQFFRVLGTGGRLFVHRRENPLPAVRAERDVFEGRLVKISQLSFHSAIRRYYATHVSATHFFRPADFAQKVAGGGAGQPLSIRDLAGDEVVLAPADVLAIDVKRPGEVRVGLPRDRFPDEAAARRELETLGGIVSGPAETPTSLGPPPALFTFTVRFPEDRRQRALSALGDRDRRVEFRDSRETHKARVVDLSATASALSIQGKEFPLETIAVVKTLAAVQIPDDAYLLIEGDLPRDHVHTVIASGLLLLFGVVNVIGLLQGLRR